MIINNTLSAINNNNNNISVNKNIEIQYVKSIRKVNKYNECIKQLFWQICGLDLLTYKVYGIY